MATKKIVLMAKHITNQNRVYGEPDALKISAESIRLADDLVQLIGGSQNLSSTASEMPKIVGSKLDLIVAFYNNRPALIKVLKQLAKSVGSESTNDYVLHLSHNAAYTGDKHIGRDGCGNIMHLLTRTDNIKLTDDDQVMIAVLLEDILAKLQNCYWHQCSFIPF